MSWSAIAQIESGRRKDVRLSSLSALADALRVSVDYLIGTTSATSARLFEHRMLSYGSDDELLAAAVPFFAEGIERSHCLLAVMTAPQTALLRDGLDDDSVHVVFADWTDWYRSPQEALRRYGAFVNQKFDAGAAWIRVVAEAAWTCQSDELAMWARYESLVNLAFASSPVTIICTYDKRTIPEGFVADARYTHPEVVCGNDATASPTYREPQDFLLAPQAASRQGAGPGIR